MPQRVLLISRHAHIYVLPSLIFLHHPHACVHDALDITCQEVQNGGTWERVVLVVSSLAGDSCMITRPTRTNPFTVCHETRPLATKVCRRRTLNKYRYARACRDERFTSLVTSTAGGTLRLSRC